MSKVAQFFLVAILIFIGARQAAAQRHCNRHVESQGGFSICIPDGWTGRERENQKYKVLFGQPSDSFTPNINFKEEMTAVALSEYVAAGIKNMIATKEKLGADSLEPLSRSDFTTEAGLRGIRCVFLVSYKSFWIRSIQYYFHVKKDRKLIITGTSLEKNKEVFDRLFDRAAKSFRMD